MLHGRKLRWAALLVVLLLAISAPAALAQGGTNGGKTVWGGNYTLPSGQAINGNLTVMGGNATLEPNSTVNGDVTMMGGTLQIAGHVRGNIGMLGGTVNLTGTAVVDGNISGLGGSVHRAPGAVVHGSTQGLQNLAPGTNIVLQQTGGRGPLSWFLDLIWRLFRATGLGILLAIIGAVVLLLAPRYTGQVATTVAVQPALNFATGLLTLVLAFLVGIPLLLACGLGLLVWLAAILTLLFGWIAVGLWVGQRILAGLNVRAGSSAVEVAIGVFLITWLAWILPCLGWLFGLVLGSIGVGAVLLTRFGTQPPSGLSGLNWGGGPLTPGSGPRRAVPPVETEGRAATYAAPTTYTAPAAPPAPGEGPAEEANSTVPGSQEPLPPAEGPAATMTGGAASAARSAVEPPVPGDVSQARSLDDLEAINGITPEIAGRLRSAGSTTLVALATSDPIALAGQAGVGVERVRDEDWIGQARRMLG